MALLPLGETPSRHASDRPGEVAIVYPDGALTWAEFDRQVARRARWLRDAGVEPEQLVTIALPNTHRFYEHVFAVWRLGATPHIVSPRLPPAELEATLALATPRLMINGPGKGPQGVATLAADADVSDLSDEPIASEVATYWKAMSSGGSTGRPKIIVDHQRSEIDLDAPATPASVGMTRDMVVINPGPLFHNAPFLFTTQALAIGCRVVGMERFDPELFLRLVETHRANWVQLVPTMMHRIWALPPKVRDSFDLSSLKVIWHMAAPCPPWLKAAWIDWLGGERIYELYGGTERIGSTIVRGDEWLAKPGSVGRPPGRMRIRALRPDGSDCGSGEVGELYFELPAGAAAPFHYIGDEVVRRREGWQSLGDLGSIDPDGFVFLADRRTDLILRGGANIYPAEIEAAIDAFPDVSSSVVVGLPSADLGQTVHAIVQPGARGLEVQDLHAFLMDRLTPYKLPESYEIASAFLRDDAGKVRRSALREERAAWLSEGREFQILIARSRS